MHVLSGSSIKEIANTVHLSQQSVKAYLGKMLRRFGAANRLQLVLALTREICPEDNLFDRISNVLNSHQQDPHDSCFTGRTRG